MQSKGNAPSAKQKLWRETLRTMGCVNHPGAPAEIHHVVGATGKQNKVSIGHWFLLPLCSQCHRLEHEANVDLWPKRFCAIWGTQRALFAEVVDWYLHQGYTLPFDQDVNDAIYATRK